ncbi:MCE family protein [Pseudonocardia eucalypti]|uniref:MCE family protein n=1 Tax=Pseudonocardia eucalypti TaxID=648755 RepID=A0ABP9PM42_9PSEU|nr:phospholipid/cholesterol/gamma-HCH transport system substrate-binding protein [Pseudonocardia eucalypti]
MRYKWFGLLGLGALALAVFAIVAAYTQLFVPVVHAKVIAARSGLLLDRKADVTLRGIKIGEARAIDAVGGSAVIQIAIDREYADAVPANVTAQIVAPTVFGAKFIDLVPPRSPSTQALGDGAVIQATGVPTETNSVFESVMALLSTVRPAKLNATLGATATALRGQGADLGRFITDLNAYLTRFNSTLPAVSADLRMLPGVTATYADVAPDVLRLLGNASALSDTLQDKEDELNPMLRSVARTSDDARALLDESGRKLVDFADTARPVTRVFADYAPGYPCMFGVVNTLRIGGTEAMGGQYNGIHGIVTFLPGQPGYQKGRDDPKVGEKSAPRCWPALLAHSPHRVFDDGTTTPDFYRRKTEVVGPLALAQQLLGPAILPYVRGGGR